MGVYPAVAGVLEYDMEGMRGHARSVPPTSPVAAYPGCVRCAFWRGLLPTNHDVARRTEGGVRYGRLVDALALVESVPGWLRPEDAEKLYKLAHDTSGPILEVGTYRGKSTILMALAAKEAGHEMVLYTLDVDRAAQRAAMAEAQARGVASMIVFVRGTLFAFAQAYPQLRPNLTFVDGDHTEAGLLRDLEVLESLVPSGGFLLFHDFNDPLNEDPACAEIRVRPTVERSWVASQCEFNGEFGCCGLFTRRDPPPANEIAVADLLRLDSARDQYLHRVRYPAGRAYKRLRGTRLHADAG